MPFLYQRIIHFRDTDAAGVVYFANVLSICHEAYEASLQSVSIDLRTFFGDRHRAIPIVHASIDFLQPMFCGERYTIELIPTLIKSSEFSIAYQIYPSISPKSTELATPVPNTLEMDSAEKPSGEGLTAEQTQLKQTSTHTPHRQAIAKAQSRHVCIHPLERKRLDLDDVMMTWLIKYGKIASAQQISPKATH